jgi:hypothetical protein
MILLQIACQHHSCKQKQSLTDGLLLQCGVEAGLQQEHVAAAAAAAAAANSSSSSSMVPSNPMHKPAYAA